MADFESQWADAERRCEAAERKCKALVDVLGRVETLFDSVAIYTLDELLPPQLGSSWREVYGAVEAALDRDGRG